MAHGNNAMTKTTLFVEHPRFVDWQLAWFVMMDDASIAHQAWCVVSEIINELHIFACLHHGTCNNVMTKAVLLVEHAQSVNGNEHCFVMMDDAIHCATM